MAKRKIVVNCVYCDTGDIKELIHRSFWLFLQRELAKSICTFANKAETAVSYLR